VKDTVRLSGPIAGGLVETWTITAVHVATILLVSLTLLTALYNNELTLYRTLAGYLELTIWLAVGLATVSRGAERLLLFTRLLALGKGINAPDTRCKAAGKGLFGAAKQVNALNRCLTGAFIRLFASDKRVNTPSTR
jgi:hypothetical protein